MSSMPPGPSYPYNSPQYGSAPQYGAPPGAPQSAGPLAIISLVLGIVSIVGACCCHLFSLPFGIGACVCGFIAMNQANAGTAGGKGLAVAGLICGGVSIVLAIIIFILAMALKMPGVLEQIQNAR